MAVGTPVEELKAMAHPLRLRILQSLAAAERNVGEIEEAAGIGQPALSQQLGVLRKAGLVEPRKQGKLVYYRLARARIAEVVAVISALSGKDARAPSSPARKPSPGAANFARIAAR